VFSIHIQKAEAVDYQYDNNVGLCIKVSSEKVSKRLFRAAINHAIQHGLPSVTIVHKGNIMKYTEGAFKQWGFEVAEQEFGEQTYTWGQWERTKETRGQEAANAEQKAAEEAGKIIVKDIIADNFLQQILLDPKSYAVVATMNLNGDYISDAL